VVLEGAGGTIDVLASTLLTATAPTYSCTISGDWTFVDPKLTYTVGATGGIVEGVFCSTTDGTIKYNNNSLITVYQG